MWLLVFIFVFITLMLGWMLFGYFILMYFIGLFKKSQIPSFPEIWPKISIVIPSFNEERDVLAKLQNVRELDYPEERLEIVFADGGSTDQTVKLLEEAIGKDNSFKIIGCPKSGKINQLNYVLPQLKGEIILNTDVDARLNSDALKWICAEFNGSPDTWVVGAYCYPDKTLEVEHYYWSAQNKGRFIESNANSSSIVIAQCYAFRRGLLKAFPDDVIADDIYVPFLSGVLGRNTIYSRYAVATELRTPQNYSDFLTHKFRKSNAFLKESLRFIYRLPEMKPFFKTTFLTRIAQQLFLPWAFLSWMLIAGALLTMLRYDIVIFGFAVLLILFLLTSQIFSMVKLPGERHRYPLLTIIKGYILTNMIMLATALSYPFFRQGSIYPRINDNDDKAKKQ